MALLLGIITGILAFIPNIGAFITGVLMVAVGLQRRGRHRLLGDRHLFRRADLRRLCRDPDGRQAHRRPAAGADAVAQILASALFGVLGLALADPMIAMIKVALERNSERARARRGQRRRRHGDGATSRRDPALRLLALVGRLPRAHRARL